MERRWNANILFCGFYLLILGRSESKPSPPSDYTSMFATNYAKVSRSGILPAELSSSENVTKAAEDQVRTNSSCCGGAGLQQIVYPDNSSVYLTVNPENHMNEGLPMKTTSEDASNGGRSYKDVPAAPPKGHGDFHAALTPKKLSYDSFFQPGAVHIPQFAQDRYAATRTRVKKPESSRGKPSRRPTMPVQLPYQPDFSDSLNTYLPPPPQKSYDDGPPVTSYDAKDSKPPEKGPVLPYAPDFSPSAEAPSENGYGYPPPDTTAPKKPEKSPPFIQSEPGPSKSNMPDSEMPGSPPGSMPESETPPGYSYTPPEESQMSPEDTPLAFPPFKPPKKHMVESGPPKGYSYTPPPEESQMGPKGDPSDFPSYKPPNKPPKHEEDPYEDHQFVFPKNKPGYEEHPPYEEDTYKPPKPKQKPKPKPKPEMFIQSGHGDVPPEKLMPPSPETPPHPGYKSHRPSHDEWLFQPETNEYYYHPDEEKTKKPKKPSKAKEEAAPKPPVHEDEKYFFEPPEHIKAPHEHEHEHEQEHEHEHEHKYEPESAHDPEHKYTHTAHHKHHHKEKPEMMEDHESEDRLNKKPYSYYYIGRKLWFVPLYFSVYFIIYVTALILKSIARHKINYPHHGESGDWAGRGSRALLNETTDHVVKGMQEAANKYMHL